MKLLYTIFLALVLNGAQPVWNPSTHAVVDCAAGEWDKATFPLIQKALDSGATYIEVRPCVYAETLTIATEGVTIEAQGATIPNDGTTCAVNINAPNVTIQGDLLVQGGSDGTQGGYYGNGTGFCVNADYAHLDGVRTRNLYSFAVLAHNNAHYLTLERFEFTHICLSPEPKCYANPAIQLMGSTYATIRNGVVRGHSGGIHTWYGASYTEAHGNRLEQNYGFVGSGGTYTPRAAIENYGLEGGNIGNRYYDNVIDGSNAAGLEEADVTHETLFARNTVRNVGSGFVVMGSASNRATDITIEGNHFYGDGSDGANWFSGSGVVRDNAFIDYRDNASIGTIYIPHDALGDVEISGNLFTGNGRILRAAHPQGSLRFTDNRIEGAYSNWLFFFDGGAVGAEIAGNHIDSGARVLWGDRGTPLWVHHNTIVGRVQIAAGVVEDNTITNPEEWGPLFVQGSMVVRNNRIAADPPLWIDGSANGAVVFFNYLTTKDGAAWAMPACPPAVACEFNWTAGQLPAEAK